MSVAVSKYSHTLVGVYPTCRKEVTPMTAAQMRYYNLTAGHEANLYLKIRLALDIVRNYENGNPENYSHDEYKDCLAFIESLEP